MAASAASPVRNQRKVEDGLIITNRDGNGRFSARKSRSGEGVKGRRLTPFCFHKETNGLPSALRAATNLPQESVASGPAATAFAPIPESILGGARLILATAANSKSMSPLVGGLESRGQLIIAGAGGNEPIEVNPGPLLFGMRSIAGTMTGSSIDAEDTLSFSSLQGIRPRIETAPLANAAEAYGRMMRNEARFRIMLVTGQ